VYCTAATWCQPNCSYQNIITTITTTIITTITTIIIIIIRSRFKDVNYTTCRLLLRED
jgi:hypothetical protein